MSRSRFIVGDVRAAVDTLDDESIDLVLTSPPFLALRAYLPDDHPDKDREIGSEADPGAFIDTLLDVTERIRPKLAKHGSIAVELGDTYAGSGGGGGDYNSGGLRDGQPRPSGSSAAERWNLDPSSSSIGRGKQLRPNGTNNGPRGSLRRDSANEGGHHLGGFGWPTPKSLCMVPELYRIALAYGVNALTGRTTETWRVRNVIRWCRPNPPPGELADKFKPATSDMVIATMARDRYFDEWSIREDRDPTKVGGQRGGSLIDRPHTTGTIIDSAPALDHQWFDECWIDTETGQVLDVFTQDAWMVTGGSYKGSHYATFPEALLVKPIAAMTPPWVCRECGKPRRRVVDIEGGQGAGFRRNPHDGMETSERAGGAPLTEGIARHTRGWSCCGCLGCEAVDTLGDCTVEHCRRGVVLDPFGGTGTTAVVANGHGRDAILIDLDDRNLWLARERVGMFLDVEEAANVIDVASL